jgi:predicted O-methyltransferase YrrM
VADLLAVATEAVDRWKALQQPRELAGLLELVRPGDLAVEIGCDAGGVLWALRQAGAGRVIGIDLPAAGYATGLPLEPHGAEIIVGDSHQEATRDKLAGLLGGRPVDLLFIDADHTYQGVKRDFELYGPLVRPGGLVAFHDICHHHLFPDVRVDRLWWELVAKHPGRTREIIYRIRPWGTGMGIGVLECG